MIAFDVMLNGARIDTVFRNREANPENVRKELISRMFYDEAITLIAVK
jgi:hypothetical protein